MKMFPSRWRFFAHPARRKHNYFFLFKTHTHCFRVHRETGILLLIPLRHCIVRTPSPPGRPTGHQSQHRRLPSQTLFHQRVRTKRTTRRDHSTVAHADRREDSPSAIYHNRNNHNNRHNRYFSYWGWFCCALGPRFGSLFGGDVGDEEDTIQVSRYSEIFVQENNGTCER